MLLKDQTNLRSPPFLQSQCCPNAELQQPPWTGPASQCRPDRSSSSPRTSCWSHPGRQEEGPSEHRPSDAAKHMQVSQKESKSEDKQKMIENPIQITIYSNKMQSANVDLCSIF